MTEENKSRQWDDYFFDILNQVKQRSTCLRRQIGALAVRENHILATGYNGAPKGTRHCTEETCLRKNIPSGTRHELCKAVHAEQNLITQAAYHGVSLKGATVYCTNKPCSICTKLLINSGVVRVIYEEGYPDELTDALVEEVSYFDMVKRPIIEIRKFDFSVRPDVLSPLKKIYTTEAIRRALNGVLKQKRGHYIFPSDVLGNMLLCKHPTSAEKNLVGKLIAFEETKDDEGPKFVLTVEVNKAYRSLYENSEVISFGMLTPYDDNESEPVIINKFAIMGLYFPTKKVLD